MSLYAIDSYDRRNDHSWYKTAAASAVTASALNKPFAVEINWLKGLDVAMKNQVTDQYSYQERSEQIKLRSYFEKQHQDIELRKKLGIDNTKMIETIQSF